MGNFLIQCWHAGRCGVGHFDQLAHNKSIDKIAKKESLHIVSIGTSGQPKC